MTSKSATAALSASDEPLSVEQIAHIRDLIELRCGLDFGDSRRTLLDASVHARMQHLGIPSVERYLTRLSSKHGHEEIGALINGLTITETQFFRDPAQFGLLRRYILPALIVEREAEGVRRLRICSAGCASGEEPYSVALTWREMGLPATHPDWTIDIVGIDVNTGMLDAARRGVYSKRAVRNVEEECLRRYFTPVGRNFQLDREVARSVRFDHGSLIDEASLGSNRYDVILCKNVSIYFRTEVTRRLIRRLHDALSPGGYLLLGHSESLWQMEDGLTLVEHDGVFCYRKPSVAHEVDSAPRRIRPPELAKAPEDCYEQCLEWVRNADWPRAQREMEALILSRPSFVPAHLLLAGIHAHLGRYSEARDCAEHVLGLNTLEPKAHMLLGMIAARRGRQQEAIDSLRRALDLDGSLALAYFWLGNLYRDRGNVEGACVEYACAVARHNQRGLNFTEEFAADLRPAQIVDFCRNSLERLRGTW
jgi:chemotaxis protein methyltransferase CheR